MTDLILTYSVHLVLVLLLQIRVQADSSLDNSVKQLLGTSRYNKDMKPDSFTYVSVQVDIYDMAKTEAKNAEFTLELYLRMWWKDARLQYSNYSSLGNVSKLEIPEVNTAQIWQPDLYFLTDRKPEIHDRSIANRIIYIYRNGSIVYSERTSLTLRSSLDLTFYPYDQQMCLVELQSFAYTNDSLILNWHDSNPVKISGAKMAEYLISVGEYGHGDKPPLEQIGIYSTLKASIMLKRTGHAHFYQLYGPSFAVVFVSWLALFLDEKKVSPRLTVHTGCVIALTTQWIGIYFLLPAVSYIRAIDIWMITHLLLVVFAFLANILSLMARRDDRKNEIDKRKDSGGCEENLFKTLIHMSTKFKTKCCPCCCSCFRRLFCSCEAELKTGSKDDEIANRQGKLIEIVAVITLFLFYVVFITVYAICVPAQMISILYLLVVATAGPFASVCLVLMAFGIVHVASTFNKSNNKENDGQIGILSSDAERTYTNSPFIESSNKDNAGDKRSIFSSAERPDVNSASNINNGKEKSVDKRNLSSDAARTDLNSTRNRASGKENAGDIRRLSSAAERTDLNSARNRSYSKENAGDKRSLSFDAERTYVDGTSNRTNGKENTGDKRSLSSDADSARSGSNNKEKADDTGGLSSETEHTNSDNKRNENDYDKENTDVKITRVELTDSECNESNDKTEICETSKV